MNIEVEAAHLCSPVGQEIPNDVLALLRDELQADVKPSPFRNRKSLQGWLRKDSYFATCERDDAGQCLPSGRSGSGGSEERKPSGEKPTKTESDPRVKRAVEVGRKLGMVGEAHMLGKLADLKDHDVGEKYAVFREHDSWSMEANDAFIAVAIEKKRPVKFIKPISKVDFFNDLVNPKTGEVEKKPTVLKREFDQLREAGFCVEANEEEKPVAMEPPPCEDKKT